MKFRIRSSTVQNWSHDKSLLPHTVTCIFPSPHPPCVFACWCVSICKLPAGHAMCLDLGDGERRNQIKCYSLILGCRLWGSSRSCVTGPGASASLPNWPFTSSCLLCNYKLSCLVLPVSSNWHRSPSVWGNGEPHLAEDQLGNGPKGFGNLEVFCIWLHFIV